MKRFFIVPLFLFILFAGGCSSGRELTVASFNVRFLDDNRPDYDYRFGGQPWPVRRPAVKAFFEQNKLDIVGLQEVRRAQVADLEDDLGKEWFIYCPGRFSGGKMVRTSDESVGVMYRKSRFEMLNHGRFWLSDNPDEPSSLHQGQKNPILVSWLHLKEKSRPEKTLWFFSAHISWAVKENPRLPDEEVEILLSRMEKITGLKREEFKSSPVPVFLVGDLNNTAEKSAIRTLEGLFRDARTTCPETASTNIKTFNSYGKEKSADIIDFIFYGAGEPKAYIVDDKVYYPGVKYISDHYPVLFRLRY